MKGFVIAGPPVLHPGGAVTVETCAGRVVLEDIEARDARQGSLVPAVFANKCAALTLNNIRGIGGLSVTSSTVSASDCKWTGADAKMGWINTYPATAGVTAGFSTIILAACTSFGGDGLVYRLGNEPPAPGVKAGACSTVLLKESLFAAGSPKGTRLDAPAVKVNGGQLLYDPRVGLRPAGKAWGFEGSGKLHGRALPGLSATGAGPGGTMRIEYFSAERHLGIVFASFVANPVMLPNVGQLWLDPASAFVIDVGTPNVGLSRFTNIKVPIVLALRGMPLVFQALAGPMSRLEASNPAHVVIH